MKTDNRLGFIKFLEQVVLSIFLRDTCVGQSETAALALNEANIISK